MGKMETTRYLIPNKITAQLVLTPVILEQIAKQWIADHPGSEFKHVGNGVWIETDPENMAVEFEIAIPEQVIKVAIQYGQWCLTPPVVEVG